jgi:hypothetical protein
MIALVCGVLSFALIVPAVIAIPLGIGVWVTSLRDLRDMETGVMDPGGRGATLRGHDRAQVGVLMSLLGTLCCSSMLVFWRVERW